MEIILKQFKGYSGSKVFLIKDNKKIFVRKTKNIDRNYERLSCLRNLGYNVPAIYIKNKDILDMQYIYGTDIKSYLIYDNLDFFLRKIFELIDSFKKNSVDKLYVDTYNQKLSWLKDDLFIFTKKQLVESLPESLPSSCYHGDLTLENIIYNNNEFYLIDAITSEYDSWVFDLAKMRQDTKCFWIARNSNDKNIKKILSIIDKKITETYRLVDNNNLLILMLLRVFPYVSGNDQKFLTKEINKLWK